MADKLDEVEHPHLAEGAVEHGHADFAGEPRREQESVRLRHTGMDGRRQGAARRMVAVVRHRARRADAYGPSPRRSPRASGSVVWIDANSRASTSVRGSSRRRRRAKRLRPRRTSRSRERRRSGSYQPITQNHPAGLPQPPSPRGRSRPQPAASAAPPRRARPAPSSAKPRRRGPADHRPAAWSPEGRDDRALCASRTRLGEEIRRTHRGQHRRGHPVGVSVPVGAGGARAAADLLNPVRLASRPPICDLFIRSLFDHA